MARMETRNREVPDSDPILDAPEAASSWRPLYRAAGMAALVTAVLLPIHLAVFIAYPMPDTATGWFRIGCWRAGRAPPIRWPTWSGRSPGS